MQALKVFGFYAGKFSLSAAFGILGALVCRGIMPNLPLTGVFAAAYGCGLVGLIAAPNSLFNLSSAR